MKTDSNFTQSTGELSQLEEVVNDLENDMRK